MKVYLLPALPVIALLWPGMSPAANPALPNPYNQTGPQGTLVVHYSIEHAARHPGLVGAELPVEAIAGTETLYVKGDRYTKVLRMESRDDDTLPLETVEIVTPRHVYHLDLRAGTGTRIDNPRQHGRRAYEKLSVAEQKAFHARLARMGGGTIELLGVGKKAGTETLLGHACDVYELAPPGVEGAPAAAWGQSALRVKSWIWRETGIPLRVRIEASGWVRDIRAMKIERDVPISASRFAVPAGVSVAEDRTASEAAKRFLLADFERLRTGKPQVIRIKVEPVPRAEGSTARQRP